MSLTPLCQSLGINIKVVKEKARVQIRRKRLIIIIIIIIMITIVIIIIIIVSIKKCSNNDWLLIALIYAVIGCVRSQLSDLTCLITNVCNRKGQIGQLS